MPDCVDSQLNFFRFFARNFGWLNVLLRFYTAYYSAVEMSPPGQIKAATKRNVILVAIAGDLCKCRRFLSKRLVHTSSDTKSLLEI